MAKYTRRSSQAGDGFLTGRDGKFINKPLIIFGIKPKSRFDQKMQLKQEGFLVDCALETDLEKRYKLLCFSTVLVNNLTEWSKDPEAFPCEVMVVKPEGKDYYVFA